MLPDKFRGTIACRITDEAVDRLELADVMAALKRHLANDWGDISPTTRQKNEQALQSGERVFSVYTDRHGVTFYVTTSKTRTLPFVYLPRGK